VVRKALVGHETFLAVCSTNCPASNSCMQDVAAPRMPIGSKAWNKTGQIMRNTSCAAHLSNAWVCHDDGLCQLTVIWCHSGLHMGQLQQQEQHMHKGHIETLWCSECMNNHQASQWAARGAAAGEKGHSGTGKHQQCEHNCFAGRRGHTVLQ
jgi:hypothetical protein